MITLEIDIWKNKHIFSGVDQERGKTIGKPATIENNIDRLKCSRI